MRRHRDHMESINGRLGEIPADLDRDALTILHDAGFIWDDRLLAFHRRGFTIEYAFLRGQRLILESGLSAPERLGQLQRLRILLQSLD
jgi:hypothetical protein